MPFGHPKIFLRNKLLVSLLRLSTLKYELILPKILELCHPPPTPSFTPSFVNAGVALPNEGLLARETGKTRMKVCPLHTRPHSLRGVRARATKTSAPQGRVKGRNGVRMFSLVAGLSALPTDALVAVGWGEIFLINKIGSSRSHDRGRATQGVAKNG